MPRFLPGDDAIVYGVSCEFPQEHVHEPCSDGCGPSLRTVDPLRLVEKHRQQLDELVWEEPAFGRPHLGLVVWKLSRPAHKSAGSLSEQEAEPDHETGALE